MKLFRQSRMDHYLLYLGMLLPYVIANSLMNALRVMLEETTDADVKPYSGIPFSVKISDPFFDGEFEEHQYRCWWCSIGLTRSVAKSG